MVHLPDGHSVGRQSDDMFPVITMAQQRIFGRSGWDISQQREHQSSVGIFDRPSPPSRPPIAKVLFAIHADTNVPNGSFAASYSHYER